MSSLFFSGRTWFRLYTDTTAKEMREKRRLQMSSLFCHMVQAVHGQQGLRNAGEKKVTNVVVVLFRAHMVQAVHGHHGLKKCGRKEGYKCRRCFVPGAHGSGCTRTPRPKKCGRKEGYKCRRCFVPGAHGSVRLHTDTTAWEMREK
jgi:hypothetical protein